MAKQVLRCCWKQLSLQGAGPPARSSHTVTALAGRVCVFGGEDAPRNAFDPRPHFLRPDGGWEVGAKPVPGAPMLGHGAAGLGSRLFVFGGRLGGANTFSGETSGETGEFLSFDAESAEWVHLKQAGGAWPEPRSFHAMCAAGSPGDSRIFVFGGCGMRGRLNDLWCFDAEAGSWHCLHPGGAAETAPRPRGGASLVASPDGSRVLLLFGFSGAQQGDIAVFDIAAGRWELLPPEAQQGEVPSPRSVFAAALAPDFGAQGEVILFGGERVASDLGHEGAGAFASDLHALDVAGLRWRSLRPEGEAPRPRGWAGMAARGADSLLLFGGLDADNTRLGDAWELALEG